MADAQELNQVNAGVDMRILEKCSTEEIIPEGWRFGTLAEIGVFRSGHGFPLVFQGNKLGEYPFFKVSDMNNKGNELFMKNVNHWISADVKKILGATEFPSGSIVFAKIGAAVFLERKRLLSQTSCLDNNMMGFVFVDPRACRRYFYYIFLKIELGKLVSATALPSISGKEIGAVNVPMPPPHEQEAIAEALSDVDGLLEGLEALIAKKRSIKQAAMQQLLTGKTRLPGFSGPWEAKPIGDIADVDPEYLPDSTDLSFRFNYISLENVDVGRLLGYSEMEFRAAPSRARKVLRTGDVLMSTVRPNLLGHLLFLEQASNAICSTGFAVLRAKPGLSDVQFLYAHLFGFSVYKEIERTLAGSNYPAISSRDVRQLKIPCPPEVCEQSAIAEVLSNMDAEIAALERRRDKTRAIKRGMMEQLLTGRVRLV